MKVKDDVPLGDRMLPHRPFRMHVGCMCHPSHPADQCTPRTYRRTRRLAGRARAAAADPARDSTPTDALAACGDGGGAYFPSLLLADYGWQPSVLRGDTVVARARREVLAWDLVPLAASQDEPGWASCHGLRFGYRGADSLPVWHPAGSSWQSARRLADSVRATHQMVPAAIRQRTS